MLIEHLGKAPTVHRDAFIAPDATVCGDVTVGAGARIMHGARVIAESGKIEIGSNCIILQNAVVRSTGKHDCTIGRNVLIGPTAHVVGATIGDDVFLATGTAIFHSSRIGTGSVVRINGIVHVNTVLAPGTTVPIGWVAVGNPAQVLSADRHEDIWEIQSTLNFAMTAYGLDAPLSDAMSSVAKAVSDRLSGHSKDSVVG